MRKVISTVLALSLLILAVGAPSCKSSDSVRAARSFAIAPVAIDAGSAIVEVLDGKDIPADVAQATYQVFDTVLVLLRDVKADVQSGKWDQAKVDAKIQLALDKITELNNSGKLKVKNPNSQARLNTYLLLAKTTVQQVGQFVRVLKAQQVDTAKAVAYKGEENRPSLTADAVSQIVVIAGVAGTNIALLVAQNNVDTLWQNAGDSLEAAIANNKARIK